MATSALAVIGIAMLTLTACDLSQKKPETIRTALPHGAAAQAAPGAPGLSVLPPDARGRSAVGVENAVGGQSVRLYGPGVSRKRQIRV